MWSKLNVSATVAGVVNADVTDRAGRLLGHVAAIDSTVSVDVIDRAARLLGHVTVDGTVSADVTDRAARLLGNAGILSAADGSALSALLKDGWNGLKVQDDAVRRLLEELLLWMEVHTDGA